MIYRNENGDKTLNETTEIVSQFNVYNSYKSQLKAYSKKRFDPFFVGIYIRIDVEINDII